MVCSSGIAVGVSRRRRRAAVTTGIVKANRDPVIGVRIRDIHGQEHDIEAVVDTGFNGFVTLPRVLISSLRLPWYGFNRATLADGSEQVIESYEAIILWNGSDVAVPVNELETMPLVGMSLLYGCRLTINVVDGGSVTIDRLPSS
jgi:clan AA aspartic protease